MGDDCTDCGPCSACGANLLKKPDPWPVLPAGTRFEPSDQELLGHLVAKVGMCSSPFIDLFIRTEDDVCRRHPERLPGTRKDGTIAHYFHTLFNAYDIHECKRCKIREEEDKAVGWQCVGRPRCEIREEEDKAVGWQCVGRPQAISENGVHLGFKRTMVLVDKKRGCKTNWVRDQFHLGENEMEKEGELVVSRIVYQVEWIEGGDMYRQKEAKSNREAYLASSQVLQNDKMPPRDGFFKKAGVHDSFCPRLDQKETKPDEKILHMLVGSCSSDSQSREGNRSGLYHTMAETAKMILTELNAVPGFIASNRAEQGEGSSLENRSKAIREHIFGPSHVHGGPGTHSAQDNSGFNDSASRLQENETSSNDGVQDYSSIESPSMRTGDSLGPPLDYLLSTQEVDELAENLATNDNWGNIQ